MRVAIFGSGGVGGYFGGRLAVSTCAPCARLVFALTALLGRKHVLGGLCKIVSYLVQPGHVRHAGFEPFFHANTESSSAKISSGINQRESGITKSGARAL
jgi:ketopantoate reductase